MTAAPARACNILQNIFGGCAQPEPPPAAAPQAPTLESSLPTEKKAVKHVAGLPIRKQTPLAAPPGVAVGSLAHFAADGTLRKGDIVVTPDGFRVYEGAPSPSPDTRMQAFAPIDARNVALAEMQSESRKADWTGTIAPPKPVVAAAPQKSKPKKRAARKLATASPARTLGM
ncbi:MAG: hypothetical protein KGM42_17985 [Hyphomicrobiales bacterium]|nr:hypothetical protein [Hyphomicrobiales bacterium]